MLQHLPTDVLRLILPHLGNADLAALRLTARFWRGFIACMQLRVPEHAAEVPPVLARFPKVTKLTIQHPHHRNLVKHLAAAFGHSLHTLVVGSRVPLGYFASPLVTRLIVAPGAMEIPARAFPNLDFVCLDVPPGSSCVAGDCRPLFALTTVRHLFLRGAFLTFDKCEAQGAAFLSRLKSFGMQPRISFRPAAFPLNCFESLETLAVTNIPALKLVSHNFASTFPRLKCLRYRFSPCGMNVSYDADLLRKLRAPALEFAELDLMAYALIDFESRSFGGSRYLPHVRLDAERSATPLLTQLWVRAPAGVTRLYVSWRMQGMKAQLIEGDTWLDHRKLVYY